MLKPVGIDATAPEYSQSDVTPTSLDSKMTRFSNAFCCVCDSAAVKMI
jgi:hypothetical protein